MLSALIIIFQDKCHGPGHEDYKWCTNVSKILGENAILSSLWFNKVFWILQFNLINLQEITCDLKINIFVIVVYLQYLIALITTLLSAR